MVLTVPLLRAEDWGGQTQTTVLCLPPQSHVAPARVVSQFPCAQRGLCGPTVAGGRRSLVSLVALFMGTLLCGCYYGNMLEHGNPGERKG